MITLPTASVNDVMSWGPCVNYPRKRVEELFAGRSRLNALEILDLDIPSYDRLWAMRDTPLVPAIIQGEFEKWDGSNIPPDQKAERLRVALLEYVGGMTAGELAKIREWKIPSPDNYRNGYPYGVPFSSRWKPPRYGCEEK